jgi:hypothetical protein
LQPPLTDSFFQSRSHDMVRLEEGVGDHRHHLVDETLVPTAIVSEVPRRHAACKSWFAQSRFENNIEAPWLRPASY